MVTHLFILSCYFFLKCPLSRENIQNYLWFLKSFPPGLYWLVKRSGPCQRALWSESVWRLHSDPLTSTKQWPCLCKSLPADEEPHFFSFSLFLCICLTYCLSFSLSYLTLLDNSSTPVNSISAVILVTSCYVFVESFAWIASICCTCNKYRVKVS